MRYYNVKEIAEMFKVHPETIKREVAKNRLRCFRVGSETRFTEEHINDYTNVRNYSRTVYELELEEKVKTLEEQLRKKDLSLDVIRNELLKIQEAEGVRR